MPMHEMKLQEGSLGHQSTLSKEHIDRMVSALDATAEKTQEIEALQRQLKQAEDRALLYEVSTRHDVPVHVQGLIQPMIHLQQT